MIPEYFLITMDAKKSGDIAIPPHQGLLSELFERARAADEFEFCSALLRIRGMEDAGWDPLLETEELVGQILAQVHAPIEMSFRVRLYLFIYCHLAEMDGLWSTLANMVQIAHGSRYSLAPLKGVSISAEVKSLRSAGEPELQVFLTICKNHGELELFEMAAHPFDRQVRNAFMHSDYVLTPDSFNIRDGEPVLVNGSSTHRVPMEWLLAKVEAGINLALFLLHLRIKHIRSYSESKELTGRVGPNGEHLPVKLLASPERGLYGFSSP
jgi:hypothetical protein